MSHRLARRRATIAVDETGIIDIWMIVSSDSRRVYRIDSFMAPGLKVLNEGWQTFGEGSGE